MKIVFIAYCVYVVLLSFITLCAYGIDKRKATRGKRRVSEKTLLGMSLLGGAIGGFIGMQMFRHKTKLEHWYFTLLNIIGIIIHVFLIIYLHGLI